MNNNFWGGWPGVNIGGVYGGSVSLPGGGTVVFGGPIGGSAGGGCVNCQQQGGLLGGVSSMGSLLPLLLIGAVVFMVVRK